MGLLKRLDRFSQRVFNRRFGGNYHREPAIREIIIGSLKVLHGVGLALNLNLFSAQSLYAAHEQSKVGFSGTHVSVSLNGIVCIEVNLSEFKPGGHVGCLLLIEGGGPGCFDFLYGSIGILLLLGICKLHGGKQGKCENNLFHIS